MVARDAALRCAPALRCSHCGRVVQETQHTRMDYAVDYYSLHTGAVETCSLVAEDGERRLTYQRLLSAEEVITCADCYRDPSVRHERELRFRAERSAERNASSNG